MAQWYLGVNNVQVGPLTAEEVRARLEAGDIGPTTLAWRSGMKEWLPLRETDLPLLAVVGAAAAPAQVAAGPDNSYAGFWIRALAMVIDSMFVGSVVLLLAFASGILVGALVPETERANAILLITSPVISLTTNFFYFAILQSLLEGTPGKLALNLRLVRADFRPMGLLLGTGRYFMRVIVSLPLGLGLFAVGWSPRKQGWHDRVCRTLVVDKDFLERARSTGGAPVDAPAQTDSTRIAA